MLMHIHDSWRVLRPVIALVALLTCLVGCDNGHPGAQPARIAAPVQAASVSPTPTANQTTPPAAEHFTTMGPLVAEQQADIAAERDGRVVSISVEIGDRVKRGQLMASLDDRALVAAVESQTARTASLRAQIAEWESEQKMDQSDLRRADGMRQAKNYQRRELGPREVQAGRVIANPARSRADEAAGEAELRGANLLLEQSRMIAPFSGVVGRRSLRLNQEVKMGDALFWITAETPCASRSPYPNPQWPPTPPARRLNSPPPPTPAYISGRASFASAQS